jgi:hypothetical protein
MKNLLTSFRSAVADGNYRTTEWASTNTRIIARPIVSPIAGVSEDRKRQFVQLADQWDEDTTFMSSVTDMISHPAYRAIIAMGHPAIGLILDRLESHPGFWFQALYEITGENPVRQEDAGVFDLMTEAWVDWGAKQNYR